MLDDWEIEDLSAFNGNVALARSVLGLLYALIERNGEVVVYGPMRFDHLSKLRGLQEFLEVAPSG